MASKTANEKNQGGHHHPAQVAGRKGGKTAAAKR